MSVPHKHSNPSPSHVVAAYCNGGAGGVEDTGCGGPVPLYVFPGEQGQRTYLHDIRGIYAVLGLPTPTWDALPTPAEFSNAIVLRLKALIEVARAAKKVSVVDPAWALVRNALDKLAALDDRKIESHPS